MVGRGRSPCCASKEKGKSTGILENVLTPRPRQHPWFRRFASELPDGRRLRVVENRLFDLVAEGDRFPAGVHAHRVRDRAAWADPGAKA